MDIVVGKRQSAKVRKPKDQDLFRAMARSPNDDYILTRAVHYQYILGGWLLFHFTRFKLFCLGCSMLICDEYGNGIGNEKHVDS